MKQVMSLRDLQESKIYYHQPSNCYFTILAKPPHSDGGTYKVTELFTSKGYSFSVTNAWFASGIYELDDNFESYLNLFR